MGVFGVARGQTNQKEIDNMEKIPGARTMGKSGGKEVSQQSLYGGRT